MTLGVGPDFHAGQRNDATSCNFCHRPNQSSSGWAANQKDFVHSIHGAEKRSQPFTWHALSPEAGYWQTTYPAQLNHCEACHLPGTYDFSTSAAQLALPNMLYSTVGQGRYNSNAGSPISPYVTSDNTKHYGLGFSTTTQTWTLPDGVSGTQTIAGITTSCTPESPCLCTTSSPCRLELAGQYMLGDRALTFTQQIGATITTCSAATPCSCTTSQPCRSVTTCSLSSPCQAYSSTLVNSPIAAACSGCHDSAEAFDHMQTQGASLWEPRSTAFSKAQKEQCLICHGPGRVAAIGLMHTVKQP